MKRVLTAMFGVGLLAVLAQVTLLREMLVVFHGNELCFGAIMACWLVCVGLGALGARLLRRYSRFMKWTRHLLGVLPVLVALLLPLQVWVLRGVRLLLGVGAGEYVPFPHMLATVFLVCLPGCAAIGIFFPLACEWGVKDRRRVDQDVAGAVSRVYAVEALGSMLGGALLTFVLLPRLTPVQVMCVAAVIGLPAGACVTPVRGVQWALTALALLLGASALVMPGWVADLEGAFVQRRWQAFGVLQGSDSASPHTRLVASLDTVYQNVALIESQGQYAVYGDGKLLFVFPDELGDEHRIHPLMGMHPHAKRVLMLGGNPVGDLPQLLKYPLAELVFVELDPGIVEGVRGVAPQAVAHALADERVTHVIADGVRYVQKAQGLFDVIFVNAPEPSTSGANRFYTVEFYERLQRILADDGIVITGVTVSERLQREASAVGGTVYQALHRVFPVVKATAETQTCLFAGARRILPDGTPRITFDRQVLYERSRAAGVATEYFRPEWFLGADAIDKVKTDLAAGRLRDVTVAENRLVKPAACFANLTLWSQFSGSGLERVLGALERLNPQRVTGGLLAAGGLLLLLGAVLRCRGGERAQAVWVRGIAGVVLASIGCFSMSMEVLLVMVFQGLYGNVYTRMGLIVAAFMLGLVVGAPTGRAICRRGATWSWGGLFAICAVLLLAAAAVPRMMLLAYRFMGHPALSLGLEGVFYLMVAGLGLMTGGAFPLANQLFADAGGSLGVACAVTDASDHLGAAMGALLVGVVLLPVLGVDGACRLLAALMLATLMALAAAVVVRP